MRRRPPADGGLQGTRRSHTFYPVRDPDLQARMHAVSFEGYYTYLLHQDLDFVIPYDLGRGDGPSARVVGPDVNRARPLIEDAISDRDGTRSFSDALRHFVSSSAQYLVIAGPVTYEIDYLRPADTQPDRPTSFRLELVLPGTLAEHQGRPIQYVPAAFGGPQDESGLHYVELDPATLVTFRLDPDLEAPVRKMIEFLRAANLQQGAEAILMEQSMTGSSPYNFSRHQRERSELFAKVTQPVGWNVRGLFKENHLEPYDVWRQLRFLEFKVRLRNSIMDRLNATIAEVGKRLDFEATIELTGLPTLADVESAKEDFRRGRRGFSDLAVFAI
jgi:hypothetical protein